MQLSDYQNLLEKEKKGLPNLPNSNYELIQKQTALHPKRQAMHFFMDGANYETALSWNYQELIATINQTANLFRSLGIHRNEVVTYMLPNAPATVFTVIGGEVAGIVSAINAQLEALHIEELLEAMDTKILVTLSESAAPELWKKVVKAAGKASSLKTILTLDLGDYAEKSTKKSVTTLNGIPVYDFHASIASRSKTLQFTPAIQADNIASLYHTGGTTGRPKIAQRTHGNEVFNTWAISDGIEGNSGQKVLFCGLPWFHVNAVIVTGFTVFCYGHTLILGTPAGYKGNKVIPNFWKIIEYYKISFFSCVPTILQFLLSVPNKGVDVSSLEFAICGAAPLSVKLFNDFEKHSGVNLIEGYGFTEGACANSINPPNGTRKVGSIGLQLPFHQLKVVILDEEGTYLRDANTNEIGIIVASGPNVFPGYKEAIHNKNIWVDDGQQQWYNTGDMGRQDEDHYFWLTGRKKELIIRGGHNIDPKSIEEPLSKHPAVAAVAAVGRPDKRVGELPVAYIQLKPNQVINEEELLEYGKQNISERAAQPKRIYLLDELPLTAVGKVFKPKLSDLQNMEISRAELNALDLFDTLELHVALTSDRGRVTYIKATSKDGKDYTDTIQQILSEYTFPFEIVV